MAKLSLELQRYFFEEERQSHVKLADILALAGERLFGFLFVVLSLPSALPVPAPGYSIPFAIVIFLLAVQLICGAKRPWLPQGMMNGKMKLETVQGFIKAGIPWLQKIEAIARPRLSYICTSLPGRVILGCVIALMSISMMIPIPGTNTIPAMGIFITSFGLLEDDGAISLGGLFVSVVGASVSIGIVFFGVSILSQLKDWILSLLG
ncbi:exopolysaccharide biosynthesis protein [Lyngbya aestuarii]|uniref:exopolysaccharide biosynthesis protein n=1 Tax=Lyngbya aestuarii TaxID=118322 RepID=UPI00403D85A0